MPTILPPHTLHSIPTHSPTAPPVLSHRLVYETASTGHSLTIKCDLDKESPTPNPTPCWSWDIHVLTANSTLKNITNQTLPRISISSSGKALVIDPVTEEDYTTEFVCVVQNTIAKDNQTTRLLHQEGLSLCVLSSEGHSHHQVGGRERMCVCVEGDSEGCMVMMGRVTGGVGDGRDHPTLCGREDLTDYVIHARWTL